MEALEDQDPSQGPAGTLGAGDAGPGDVDLDGRAARGQRTRQAIVEAVLALLREGDLRPTAPRIAERAGVSVRSVFQHFDDLESLFAMVAQRVVDGLGALIEPIDPAAPLDERIASFVAQRRRVLEAVDPVRRAANVHAPTSPVLQGHLRAGHDYLRNELASVFAPELEGAGDRAGHLLDVMDLAVSWGAWDQLRSLQGCSSTEIAEVMETVLDLALRP